MMVGVVVVVVGWGRLMDEALVEVQVTRTRVTYYYSTRNTECLRL